MQILFMQINPVLEMVEHVVEMVIVITQLDCVIVIRDIKGLLALVTFRIKKIKVIIIP